VKFSAALIFILAAIAGGCSARSTGNIAVKTISFAGTVATKTTVAAVKTSGKIALGTTKAVVTTSGSVAKGVASAAFVTFKDTATGISKQIPYSEGLRLYAASQTAKFDLALKGFQLLRSGVPVMTAQWAKVKPGTYSDPVLSPGDVVQVSSPKTAAAKIGKHS